MNARGSRGDFCSGIGALAIAGLLAACPKEDPDGEDGGDATSTSGDEHTSAAPTTGPGPEPSSLLCQEACAHLEACGGDSVYYTMLGLDACVSLCERSALLDTAFCRSAAIDLYTCLRDEECEDVEGVPSGACGVANADYTISCAGACPAFVDEAEPGQCTAIVDCVHAFAVGFVCAVDTCRCVYDAEGPEVEFAACAAADVCAGGEAAIFAAGEACCDMPFTPYDL